jgi:carboxyl-terminal processing protease
VAHVKERGIDIGEEDIVANRDYVTLKIKNELFYSRLGVSAASRVLLEGDEQIQAALAFMPEARELAEQARSAMAQRR